MPSVEVSVTCSKKGFWNGEKKPCLFQIVLAIRSKAPENATFSATRETNGSRCQPKPLRRQNNQHSLQSSNYLNCWIQG